MRWSTSALRRWMSSPAAGAATISDTARQSSRRRAIAPSSSGAGRTPAVVLGRRLDHRRLDVQASALEVLPGRVLDCPHLRLLRLALLVERGEVGLRVRDGLVVALENGGAEIAQPSLAARIELEQLVPEACDLPPSLGSHRR